MKHIILASVSVSAIVAGPAFAQPQNAPVPQTTAAANAPQGAAPSSVTQQDGLAEIIVTAQRRAESAQKTPIAIAVVKPEELIRQNVTRAEDLSRVVPALVATASGGPNTTFFLRGVGNSTANSYSDPAISFNYDGVYIGRPNSTQGFFYDLQRIEVLKGPQGTLYGRNATGGAINVLPNRPVVGENSGQFQASYGNYNAIQAQGAVNLAIGDDGAFRLAGTVNRHKGYLSDGTSDQREFALRGQVLANLTPNLTTRIGVDYSHQGGAGTGSYIYGTFGLVSPTTYGFTPTPQLGPKIGVHDPRSEAFVQTRYVGQAGRFGEATGSYPSQDNSNWGVTSETNWKTSAGTLTVQGAYRNSHINSLGTTSNFRAFIIKEDTQQTSVEARFAGKVGPVDYLIGGFYFDEDIDNHSVINQYTLTPFQDYKTGTTSKAGFGRLALHATDTITLTAAGRYTDDVKRMNGISSVYVLFCGPPGSGGRCDGSIPGTTAVPLEPLVNTAADLVAFYAARGVAFGPPGSRGPNVPVIFNTQIPNVTTLEKKKFTYRLAADWQFTPRNLLYASFETGFHSGGFNFAKGLETYAPESIKAFTVGSKNRFLDNRLQLNVEGFYWKYRNQQISQFGFDLATPVANSVFYTSNVGNSTIKGVDVDGEFLVTPTTRLMGSVQYLKTKYSNNITYSPNQGVPPNFNCPYTTTVYRGVNSFAVDCSGKGALFAPRWSFNVSVEQTVHLDGYKLVGQGGTRWRGNFYAATSYQPWVISKSTFQSDASLTLAPDSDVWFVSGFINNIENKRRITQSNLNSTLGVRGTIGGGVQSAVATAPRTFGVRAGVRFK